MIRSRTAARLSAFLVLLGLACVPHSAHAERAIGDTRVFTVVPDPGQPAGMAVDGAHVVVTTLGLATAPLTDPKVFDFDLATGQLGNTHTIPRMMPASAMALSGLATDAAGRAYVVDMNGRIIRLHPRDGTQETYAEFPPAVGGFTTMPYDIAFDAAGYAYVTDQNLAAIWRVPPGGGAPLLWFQDPRLFGYLVGPTGIRIDPSGRHLYFTVARADHDAPPRQSVVYRLPIDDPSPVRLEEFFRYPSGALAFGIAFGSSGKLYVALAGTSQVSILRPDGTEEMRFPSAEENAARSVPYDRPLAIAFDGRGSLLVTNSNILSIPNPSRWVVFDVFVGDTELPLARPAIPQS